MFEVVLDPEGAVHVAAGYEELADLLEGELIDDILLDETDFLFFLLHADLNFFELGRILSNAKGGGGGAQNLTYQ